MQMRLKMKKPAAASQNIELMRSFILLWKRSAKAPNMTPANAPAPTDQNPNQLASCWSKPNGPMMISSADDHAC